MTSEKHRQKEQRFSHIRRTKKLLRFLPRRATVHRYPFLKRFADAARKRFYLWSFRTKEAVPALYAGSILTFLPVYGIQIPLALLLAFTLKANLPILAGLQMVSNPLTVPFIYWMAYLIGDFLLHIFGNPEQAQEIVQTVGSGKLLKTGIYTVTATMLGGAIMGYFIGFTLSLVYRVIAARTARRYALLKGGGTPFPYAPQAKAPAGADASGPPPPETLTPNPESDKHEITSRPDPP